MKMLSTYQRACSLDNIIGIYSYENRTNYDPTVTDEAEAYYIDSLKKFLDYLDGRKPYTTTNIFSFKIDPSLDLFPLREARSISDESTPIVKHFKPTLKLRSLCSVEGCKRKRITKGLCFRHGGGKVCEVELCQKMAAGKLCKAHGGGKRCQHPNCTKSSQGGGYCRSHGGGKLCSLSGCDKIVQYGQFCSIHGQKKICIINGCTNGVRSNGLCSTHGGGRRCSVKGCEKPSRRNTFCVYHLKMNQK